MIRQAILVTAIAGMTTLAGGQPFAGTALAEPPSPTPTGSPANPVPDTHLKVTVAPDKVQPGGTVKIQAVAPQGLVPAHAGAQSPVLDSDSLTTTGNVAAGTAHVRADAKAGVYPVLVQAMTPDTLKLRGTAQITVVVSVTSPRPATPAVPRGTAARSECRPSEIGVGGAHAVRPRLLNSAMLPASVAIRAWRVVDVQPQKTASRRCSR